MGSLPKLKIKDELHYRKGPTSGGCSQCGNAKQVKIIGIVCAFAPPIKIELRCKLMGDGESRRYRIQPDNICDRFDNTEYLKRLRGF